MIDTTLPRAGRQILLSTVWYESSGWMHRWKCPGPDCKRKRDVAKPYDKSRDGWTNSEQFLCDKCRGE